MKECSARLDKRYLDIAPLLKSKDKASISDDRPVGKPLQQSLGEKRERAGGITPRYEDMVGELRVVHSVWNFSSWEV